jgi:hypothetical protein
VGKDQKAPTYVVGDKAMMPADTRYKSLKRQLFLQTVASRGTYRHISGVNCPSADTS